MKTDISKYFISALGLALALLSDSSLARPINATGSCDDGGTLSVALKPYQGPATAMLSDRDFVAAHRAATSNEISGIKSLKWTSGPNRAYRNGDQIVIIATVCNPANCDDRAYIAFEPKTKLYGGAMYEGGHVREYGANVSERTYDFNLGGALTCARNADWAERKK